MTALARPSSIAPARSHTGSRVSIFMTALLGGGAERVMVDLAAGFAERNVPVDLVLGVPEGPYLSQVEKSVRVISLNARGTASKLWKLSRYLKQEQPIGLISVLDNINLATMARNIAGVPTRVVINVGSNLSVDLADHGGIRGWLKPTLVRVCYPWADNVACVSAGVAEDLAKRSNIRHDRLKVIYNPVRLERIKALAAQPSGHPWFDQPNVPLFLGAGRLTPQKDFPTLIRAFAQIRKAMNARLGILGEGKDLQALKALAAELGVEKDVAFLGFSANPYAFMARANVFALSSAWEGLGMVLIEAMACGTPVVSTDCPSGPREVLAEGKFGRLTKVGNASGLAAAMLHTLQSPCDRNLLHARAAEFTMERAVDQYLGLFK